MTDDQRGAEDARMVEEALHCAETGNAGHWPTAAGFLAEEVYRLRAELAETRDRRDYLQGQLDIIYDAEYSRNDTLKRRIEKLTAELAELHHANQQVVGIVEDLTTAGDALADAADRVQFVHNTSPELGTLYRAERAWRSVRGDAPTQPPPDAPESFTVTAEWIGELHDIVQHTRGGEPWLPEHVTELLHNLRRDRDRRARELAAAEAAAVRNHRQWRDAVNAAAPAVARTDGQPPAGYGPCRDCPPPGQFEVVCGFCGEEVPTLAQVEDGLVDWPTDEEQRDGLTAEQYRHIYDDLIHGLAVDLGLDPEKAGGGSVTAAVRRLVAGVSVPQKSTESPGGDTTHDIVGGAKSAPGNTELDDAIEQIVDDYIPDSLLRIQLAGRVLAEVMRRTGLGPYDRPVVDTAAPAVRVWQSDDGDWGWACARCDYRSVSWWSDRAVAERAAVEHGRDRCRAAGGSAPASTDGDQR